MVNKDYETVPEPVEWVRWTGHNIDEVLALGGHGMWSLHVWYPSQTLCTNDGAPIAHIGNLVVYFPRTGAIKGYSPEKFAELFRLRDEQ